MTYEDGIEATPVASHALGKNCTLSQQAIHPNRNKVPLESTIKKNKYGARPMSSEEHASEEATEGSEAKPVGGKKKLIIIIVGVVVLLAGAGAGAYFMGLFGGKAKEKAETAETKEGEHGSEEAAKEGEHGGKEGEHGAAGPATPVFYDLPEFLVNLNSTGKNVSFLKMRIAVELEKQEDVPKFEAYMPRTTDAINGYLRELRATDLSGSAGMARLKEELLLRLNKSSESVKVRNVYVKQILVQ